MQTVRELPVYQALLVQRKYECERIYLLLISVMLSINGVCRACIFVQCSDICYCPLPFQFPTIPCCLELWLWSFKGRCHLLAGGKFYTFCSNNIDLIAYPSLLWLGCQSFIISSTFSHCIFFIIQLSLLNFSLLFCHFLTCFCSGFPLLHFCRSGWIIRFLALSVLVARSSSVNTCSEGKKEALSNSSSISASLDSVVEVSFATRWGGQGFGVKGRHGVVLTISSLAILAALKGFNVEHQAYKHSLHGPICSSLMFQSDVVEVQPEMC